MIFFTIFMVIAISMLLLFFIFLIEMIVNLPIPSQEHSEYRFLLRELKKGKVELYYYFTSHRWWENDGKPISFRIIDYPKYHITCFSNWEREQIIRSAFRNLFVFKVHGHSLDSELMRGQHGEYIGDIYEKVIAFMHHKDVEYLL